MARNPFAVALARSQSPVVARSSGGGALVPAWQNKIPQWSQWSTRKAIQEGFKSSVWVYICIERLMKSAASVPWVAYVRTGRDKWEPEPDHPLSQLMKQPNPFMSGAQFIEAITSQLYLAGNALIHHITLRGTPVELWPVWELDKIQVVPSRENFIDRYDYRRDGEPIPLYPEELTHLMFLDPGNPFWGMAPLQAAARVVDTDVEAVRWNKLVLQNRAVTDGVFSFPNVLSQEDFETARVQLREQYSGADNARAPWALGGGAEYHQMSMTPAELDYLESRKFTVEEICAVFGVPLPMVGVYRDATLANIETARRIFWADTVVPFLDGVKDPLNRSITPRFGRRGDLELRYDTSKIEALQEDLTKKIEQLDKLTNRGVPLNVAVQRLGLGIDKVEGGDVGLVPSTMIALTVAGDPDPVSTDPLPQDPKPAPKKEAKAAPLPPIEVKAGDVTLHLTVPQLTPNAGPSESVVAFTKNEKGELIAAKVTKVEKAEVAK